MNPLPARFRILALASDIAMPTAWIAAAVGVSRQRVHFVLMRDAPASWTARGAARPRVNAARVVCVACGTCGRGFRTPARRQRRYCSRSCQHASMRKTTRQVRFWGLTNPAYPRVRHTGANTE